MGSTSTSTFTFTSTSTLTLTFTFTWNLVNFTFTPLTLTLSTFTSTSTFTFTFTFNFTWNLVKSLLGLALIDLYLTSLAPGWCQPDARLTPGPIIVDRSGRRSGRSGIGYAVVDLQPAWLCFAWLGL